MKSEEAFRNYTSSEGDSARLRLMLWRKREGLTIAEAGERFAVNAKTFGAWERGAWLPTYPSRLDMEREAGIPAHHWILRRLHSESFAE